MLLTRLVVMIGFDGAGGCNCRSGCSLKGKTGMATYVRTGTFANAATVRCISAVPQRMMPSNGLWCNPAVHGNWPDPGGLRTGPRTLLAATTGGGSRGAFPLHASKDDGKWKGGQGRASVDAGTCQHCWTEACVVVASQLCNDMAEGCYNLLQMAAKLGAYELAEVRRAVLNLPIPLVNIL
eukprot:287737-Pleurochrysis_carterae.AAC.2